MGSSTVGNSNARIETISRHFQKHPSMDPSYGRPGAMRYPSHRSGFVSGQSSREGSPSNTSRDGWEPPQSGSAWYRHQPYSDRADSCSTSSNRASALSEADFQYATNLPLPKGSMSPSKEQSPEASEPDGPEFPTAAIEKTETNDISLSSGVNAQDTARHDELKNYIRFSVRADVMQHTEPLELAINFTRRTLAFFYGSKKRIFAATTGMIIFSIFINMLFGPPSMVARPDIIKLASFTKSFEPLIHYSESGIVHLEKIQETGTAVWDLGEAVRIANMTSSPIISEELDQMADSLNTLAAELTGFFASIDGDFDSILLTLDWARRELIKVQALPVHQYTWAVSNLHSALSAFGLISSTDTSTRANQIFRSVFGVPAHEQARISLQRAFTEIVSTLENSIRSEIKRANAVFAIYASIEEKFDNLRHIASREKRLQIDNENELLTSLWTWALGRKASSLKKYQYNKLLLEDMLDRTRENKRLLIEHNHRIVALRQSLEILRRRLMSPLLRVDETGSSLGIGMGLEGQIESLGETGDYLKDLRISQKRRVMEHLYGMGKDKDQLEIGDGRKVNGAKN